MTPSPKWKTMTVPAGVALKVLPENPNRLNVLILNISPSVSAYMGTDSSVTSFPGSNPGFTLMPAAAIENSDHKGEFWIYVDTTITLSYWEASK
jgi:hypothetical protein